MWNIAIPVLCVLAHASLVVLFLPSFWREIDARGWRWHNSVTHFFVPLVLAALIASHVLRNLGELPDWLLVVAFITLDALLLTMVLAAIVLYRRRKRAA